MPKQLLIWYNSHMEYDNAVAVYNSIHHPDGKSWHDCLADLKQGAPNGFPAEGFIMVDLKTMTVVGHSGKVPSEKPIANDDLADILHIHL